MTGVGATVAGLGALLGFLVGFSVGQGSTCAVTAGRQLVFEGRARLLAGFLVAGGVAGLVCLPLAWTAGMRAGLPPEAPLAPPLAAGALLLAAGALVNDACLFGTLARIALGEVRFLAVPLGLAAGYAMVGGLVGGAPVGPNRFGSPSPAGLLLVAASAALVAGAAWTLARGGDRAAPGRWPLRAAMVVLGGAGALLFALTPGWTYADAVRGAVAAGLGGAPVAVAAPALLTGAATLVGAVVAGTVVGRFRVERPRAVPVLRSLGGGALMAAGASFVPGGNDSLLLWAVPGGSVSGLLAYLLMTGAIMAWLAGLRLLLRPRARRIGPI